MKNTLTEMEKRYLYQLNHPYTDPLRNKAKAWFAEQWMGACEECGSLFVFFNRPNKGCEKCNKEIK